jgi:hypothetical protein
VKIVFCDGRDEGTLQMKSAEPVGTRRQMFKGVVAGGVALPLLLWGKRPASAVCTTVRGCSCLLKGTRISTSSGERLVQELQIGDEVRTLSGPKVIKWIGHRKFIKEEGRAWQDSVMPIRVARFALDDQTPHSDLYLSPLHCVYFNGALIPIMHLVNEVSIAKSMPSGASEIEYYHIELDTHEVLYAEGALVESRFDDGTGRENFSNFIEYERLYGVEGQPGMKPFAPILGYRNRREKIKGLTRSVISKVVDVRDPIQLARDQLSRRAEATLV